MRSALKKPESNRNSPAGVAWSPSRLSRVIPLRPSAQRRLKVPACRRPRGNFCARGCVGTRVTTSRARPRPDVEFRFPANPLSVFATIFIEVYISIRCGPVFKRPMGTLLVAPGGPHFARVRRKGPSGASSRGRYRPVGGLDAPHYRRFRVPYRLDMADRASNEYLGGEGTTPGPSHDRSMRCKKAGGAQ